MVMDNLTMEFNVVARQFLDGASHRTYERLKFIRKNLLDGLEDHKLPYHKLSFSALTLLVESGLRFRDVSAHQFFGREIYDVTPQNKDYWSYVAEASQVISEASKARRKKAYIECKEGRTDQAKNEIRDALILSSIPENIAVERAEDYMNTAHTRAGLTDAIQVTARVPIICRIKTGMEDPNEIRIAHVMDLLLYLKSGLGGVNPPRDWQHETPSKMAFNCACSCVALLSSQFELDIDLGDYPGGHTSIAGSTKDIDGNSYQLAIVQGVAQGLIVWHYGAKGNWLSKLGLRSLKHRLQYDITFVSTGIVQANGTIDGVTDIEPKVMSTIYRKDLRTMFFPESNKVDVWSTLADTRSRGQRNSFDLMEKGQDIILGNKNYISVKSASECLIRNFGLDWWRLL